MYHKWELYDVWFLRYGVWLRIFCHFGLFLPFYNPNNPKNYNFEKIKKTHGDIIILHMCTKNGNHMMYGSWDMEHDKQNFLSFWTTFCHFTPKTTQNIKILKKIKKNMWRCHHFTQVYQKSWSYDTLFLRYNAWQMKFLLFILGYFLPFYPPNNPKTKI